MDIYPVSGLRPLDVMPDVYGMGAARRSGRGSEVAAFNRSGFMLRGEEAADYIPTEAFANGAAPESVKQLVARKVRERVRQADTEMEGSDMTLTAFNAPVFMRAGLGGLGKAAKSPAASQVAKQAAAAAAAAAKRASAVAVAAERAARALAVEKAKTFAQAQKAAIAAAKGAGKEAAANAAAQAKLALIAATNAAKVAAQRAKYAAAAPAATYDPYAVDPNAYDPYAVDPNAYNPYAVDPNAYVQPYVQPAGGYVSPLLAPQYGYEYGEAPVNTEMMSEGDADLSAEFSDQQFNDGAMDVPSYDQPTAEVISEGESASGFAEGGMYGLGIASFERDPFLIPNMAAAGMPRGTVPIIEDEGEQQSAAEYDRLIRPPMLIESAKIGRPYKTGEGMQYLRKFTGERVEVMDPSVIELSADDVVGRSGTDRVSFFNESQFMGMGNLGADILPTAQTGAVNAAMAALASVAAGEAQLQRYSQGAYDSFMSTYAAIRSSLNSTFAALQAATEFDLSKSMTLTAQIAIYRNALNAAIAAAKPKVVKPKPPVTVPQALPAAVKETVFSKYGAIVIGGGALLVGGLLVANMMMKRRTA